MPDRAKRRYFSAQYKLRVLEEADACRAPGEVGALLRREGLYSSQLTAWRGRAGKARCRRWPSRAVSKGRRRDPVASDNERLRKENARLRGRLEQAQAILEIQKKASEILGIPLNRPANGDDA